MKTLAVFWGYLTGEEHLTEEQFAQIDFGNPAIDTEFITFDPLASSFFEGRYFRMIEKRLFFPHRALPSMRTETMILYENTSIKIFDPPAELEVPVGILLCLFWGKPHHIELAIQFLETKLNLKFAPADIELDQFYNKLSKTRIKIFPKSITISNLELEEDLFGNLEVIIKDEENFLKNLQKYKPKVSNISFLVKEVNVHLEIEASIDGRVNFNQDVDNLNLQKTFNEAVSRSLYTGLKPNEAEEITKVKDLEATE